MRAIVVVFLVACAPPFPVPVAPPPPPPPQQPGTAIPFEISGTTAAVRLLEVSSHDDGRVARVLVAPGAHIRAGDELIDLEVGDRDAQVVSLALKIKSADHDVQSSSQDLAGIRTYLTLLKDPDYLAKVEGPNEGQLRYAEAAVEVARSDRERVAQMVTAGTATHDRLDAATATLSQNERYLESLKSQHGAAKTVIDYAVGRERVLATELDLATKRRDDLREQLTDAQHALAATKIVATASGVVEDVLVVPGSDVARGEPVVRISSWQ